MSEINFKRIIEEAYERGISQLYWDISRYGKFRTVRHKNAILFFAKDFAKDDVLLGCVYTNIKEYSNRKFTLFLSKKLSIKSGEHKVKITSDLETYSFEFSGIISNYNSRIQDMFHPIICDILKKRKRRGR